MRIFNQASVLMICSLEFTPAEEERIRKAFGTVPDAAIKRALLDYADLTTATLTDPARELMCAHGLTNSRQLLHVALIAFLNKPAFLSDAEEKEFLELCRRLGIHSAARVRMIGRG